MTYAQITKKIERLEKRVQLLEKKPVRTIQSSHITVGEALQKARGLWKDKPRTHKDLERVRRVLAGR